MEVKMFLWFWRLPGTPRPWGGRSQGRQGDSVSPGSSAELGLFLKGPQAPGGKEIQF